MNVERSILHLNVADFAVAVERIADSSLRSRPVIVAPLKAARAAVHDMSEEAYRDGVRKGMPLWQATRRCRSAKILPPRFERYKKVMSVFVSEAQKYTPVFEYGHGDGHLFLDVTGTHRLIGAAPDVGWRLRREVRDTVGIDPIWSLGANKLVAKVASRLVKPFGEYIVAPGEEEAFLAPVPLELLPGVESRERMRLQEFNIQKVGQLAALDKSQLFSVFGARGDVLFQVCRGIDSEPVLSHCQQSPEVRQEHVAAGDIGDQRTAEGIVMTLAVRAAMALRDQGVSVRRLALRLNYADGFQIVRQVSVRHGISDDFSLQTLARSVFERAWGHRGRMCSCLLICSRLHSKSKQLHLFSIPGGIDEKRERVVSAMDRVRARFGADGIRFGNQVSLP